MRPLILPPLVLIFAVIPLAVTAHCSKKHMSLRSDTLSVCTNGRLEILKNPCILHIIGHMLVQRNMVTPKIWGCLGGCILPQACRLYRLWI